MSNNGTGWERHRRGHFDEIVTEYDRIRPSYPDELFKDVFGYIGKAGFRALEIGAGTGKATRPFLEAGCRVTAVEMGANMAAFLRERYEEYANLDVIVAPFEEAEPSGDAYDLIYAASAFHWLEADAVFPKIRRLLGDGGVLALFRYNVIPRADDALDDALDRVYDKHYFSHYTAKVRPPKKTRDDLRSPVIIGEGFGFNDMGHYGFTDVTMNLYDTVRLYNEDEYIALVDTLSDHRALPESNRTALYAGIREAIARHGGCFREELVFQAYMGRKI